MDPDAPPGHRVTPATQRSVSGFRRTLPRQGSELAPCPPDCTEDHDAGKTAGRDHWKPRALPRPKARR